MRRLATLVITTVLLVAVVPAADAREPISCTHVTVIGIAGSGQTPGTGRQVREVIDAIEELMAAEGRTMRRIAIDYPAVDVGRTLGIAFLNGRYDESVAIGAKALVDEVTAITETCAATDVVIVGYSQGAQVFKTAAPALGTAVRAAVLLADPTAPGGALGDIATPAGLVDRVIEVCAPGDVICGNGPIRFLAHTDGYEGELTSTAAARTADLLAAEDAPSLANSGRPLLLAPRLR